jgi:hypothetical protein
MNPNMFRHHMLTIGRVIGSNPWYGLKVLTEEDVELKISRNPHVMEHAVAHAEALRRDLWAYFDIALDFSGASIEWIETLLAQRKDELDREPVTYGESCVFVEQVGSYCGEVIRHQHDGLWVETRISDLQIAAVQLGRRVWYPLTWAYLRITDGPANSLSSGYKALLELDSLRHVELTKTEPSQLREPGL